MTVADLQKILKSVAAAVEAAGAKNAGEELIALAAALQRHAQNSLAGFAQFVSTATAVGDSPLLKEMKSLYDRATDPSLTREGIVEKVRSYSGLKKAEIDAAVAGLGIKQKFKNKAEAIEALINHVMSRRGSAARAGA
jgi:hypothetical protein